MSRNRHVLPKEAAHEVVRDADQEVVAVHLRAERRKRNIKNAQDRVLVLVAGRRSRSGDRYHRSEITNQTLTQILQQLADRSSVTGATATTPATPQQMIKGSLPADIIFRYHTQHYSH